MDKYSEKLQLAVQAGKQRDYQRAIELLTEVVCNTDQYPQALLYLGRSYHAIGEYAKAINIYDFFLKIAPDSTQGYFFSGRSYLALGLYRKAIGKLKKVIEAQPEMYIAHSFIGLACLKLKRPELALKYFENALKLSPDNQNIFNGYLNALLIKAIKYFFKGRLGEALQMFEFIIEHRPEGLLAYLYSARIYREAGKFRESLKIYEKVCQLSPDDPVLKLQKALLLLRLGHRQEAYAELNRNELLDGLPHVESFTPAQLLKFSALSYFQQKEYKKAIYYGVRVLKEDYRDLEIHAIIAEAYHILGELDKARNHYTRCLEIEYKPEIHYAILQVLWEQADYSQLLQQVKKMLRANPQDKIAGYFMALVLVHTDAKPEDIIQNLQKQIHQSGPDPQLMSMMGQVYLKYDFPELAENWLLRTLKLNEADQAVLLALLEVYKRLDKPKALFQTYRRYFSYFQDDRELRKEFIKALIHHQQYAEAVAEINLLLPYETANSSLKKTLSTCYIKLKQYNDAIVLLKVLLKEKPDSLELLQAFIYCLAQTQRRRIAINLLENAKSFFQHHPVVLSLLGALYLKERQFDKALEIYRNLLSETPGNWKIYRNLAIIYQQMGNTLFARKFQKRAEEYKNK